MAQTVGTKVSCQTKRSLGTNRGNVADAVTSASGTPVHVDDTGGRTAAANGLSH
jgi:hypothetical protein